LPLRLIKHYAVKRTGEWRYSYTLFDFDTRLRWTASVVWWSEFLTTDTGVPGSIPGHYKKKVVGLELGPLSLVSTTEEVVDRKVAAPV
jgi:hypothetical protein